MTGTTNFAGSGLWFIVYGVFIEVRKLQQKKMGKKGNTKATVFGFGWRIWTTTILKMEMNPCTVKIPSVGVFVVNDVVRLKLSAWAVINKHCYNT